MQIPFFLKLDAVFIQIVKEEFVQQPQMAGILSVKAMKSAKSGKEGTPTPSKLRANFDPQPFNTGVSSGPVDPM